MGDHDNRGSEFVDPQTLVLFLLLQYPRKVRGMADVLKQYSSLSSSSGPSEINAVLTEIINGR